MTRATTPSRGRAFTLVELIATISVLGLSVAAALPILTVASDAAHRADAVSRERHDVSVAIQRIAEILRPAGNPLDTDAMLADMNADGFSRADGAGVRLDGATLIETDTDNGDHPLVSDVTRFEVRYLRDDAITQTASSDAVHTVEIRLDTANTTCATRVFCRGRMALP